jgi:hypothetical protein
MVALNILLILLGFINSVNKKQKNVDVTQMNIGEVVLSGGGGSGKLC